jgi:hypothetical protein
MSSFDGDRVTDFLVEFVSGISGIEALITKTVLPDEARLRLIINGDALHGLPTHGACCGMPRSDCGGTTIGLVSVVTVPLAGAATIFIATPFAWQRLS